MLSGRSPYFSYSHFRPAGSVEACVLTPCFRAQAHWSVSQRAVRAGSERRSRGTCGCSGSPVPPCCASPSHDSRKHIATLPPTPCTHQAGPRPQA
jgi:hypothetical protein